MNFQRYAIVLVCFAMFVFGVSAPAKAEPDAPTVDAVVQGCTEQKFDEALATVQASAGGTLTFLQSCVDPIIFTTEKNITKSVTIDGGSKVVLSGGNTTRLFGLMQPGQLTLKNIKVTNGFSINGGAVALGYNTALFTDNVIFGRNQAETGGSVISSLGGGAITLNNTTVQSNTVTTPGGWGAINSAGPLTITNSLLRGNTTTGELVNGGAGAIIAWDNVLIQNTTLSNNGNTGLYYSGAQGRSLKILNSTFTLHRWAAVLNDGPEKVTIQNTTFSNNYYGLINRGDAELLNVTFHGNTKALLQDSKYQGPNKKSILKHVTLFNNIESNLEAFDGIIYLQNTYIGLGGICFAEYAYKIFSEGHNLTSNPACASYLNQSTDRVVSSDVGIGPLADNGGPTLTHLPQPESLLIDGAACIAGITTDQRGLPRPRGAACDIGAVEVQPPAPQPSPSPSPNPIVPRARIPIVVK